MHAIHCIDSHFNDLCESLELLSQSLNDPYLKSLFDVYLTAPGITVNLDKTLVCHFQNLNNNFLKPLMATLPLIASDPRHQNIREYSLCSDRWFQVEILQTFCMSF